MGSFLSLPKGSHNRVAPQSFAGVGKTAYLCDGYLNNVRPPKASPLGADAPRLEQGYNKTRWTTRRVLLYRTLNLLNSQNTAPAVATTPMKANSLQNSGTVLTIFSSTTGTGTS